MAARKRKEGGRGWRAHLSAYRSPYAWLFLALVALDQASKAAIRQLPLGGSVEVVPGLFWLTHVQNTGSSFGLFSGANTILVFVSLVFIGLLSWHRDHFISRAEKAFLALLFAGVVGNLIDRVLLGAVTDLFDLGWFPVFNVADSCLVIGVFGTIAYETLWKKDKKPKK